MPRIEATSPYLNRPAQPRPNYRIRIYDDVGRVVSTCLFYARTHDLAVEAVNKVREQSEYPDSFATTLHNV